MLPFSAAEKGPGDEVYRFIFLTFIKAGVSGDAHRVRGTQGVPEPSATLSRHAVTGYRRATAWRLTLGRSFKAGPHVI